MPALGSVASGESLPSRAALARISRPELAEASALNRGRSSRVCAPKAEMCERTETWHNCGSVAMK